MTTRSESSQLAAIMTIVVLALGAMACAWQALRANHIAIVERQAREREVDLRQEAEAATRTLAGHAEELRTILAFYQTRVLVAESPHSDAPQDRALLRALERAEPDLETISTDAPLTKAAVLGALAISYQQLGADDQAILTFQRAVDLRTRELGPGHPVTLGTRTRLGVAYQRTKRYAESRPLLEETLRRMVAASGPNSHDAVIGATNLAVTYRQLNLSSQAIELLEPVLENSWIKENPGHPDSLTCTNALVRAYIDTDQLSRAVELFARLTRGKSGPDAAFFPTSLFTAEHLVSALESHGQIAAAGEIRRSYVQLYEARFGPEHLETMLAQGVLAENLFLAGKLAEAEERLRHCLVVLKKTKPDAWTVFTAQSMLGGTLTAKARALAMKDGNEFAIALAEAETELLTAYQGLREHEAEIPAAGKIRIVEACQRLVDLYRLWNRSEELSRWQAELASLREKWPLPTESFSTPQFPRSDRHASQ